MTSKKHSSVTNQRTKQGLVLFSGGLDSILTVKILRKQKVKIKALYFKSCFLNKNEAQKSAKKIRIPLKIIDFSKEHLGVVKDPKHGYGSQMNPCIDCRISMLKKAKKIMGKEGFDFIATGEVIGQRPMSQNRKVLQITEKESSLSGHLLRPLSAKLLNETLIEKEGFIERKKLFAISGRSRKEQIKLAKETKLQSYPSPAGGCLLTDPEFSKRLKVILKLWQKTPRSLKREKNDIELLKLGRHFIENEIKIIVGRDNKENEKIKKLALKNDILVEMENYPGPLTLIRNYRKRPFLKKGQEKALKKAKGLTRYYSTKSRNKKDAKFCIEKV